MINSYTLLYGGSVVTGDGNFKGADVLINDGRIVKISLHIPRTYDNAIDCSSAIILPGLVNMHAHGVVFGSPLFSSGSLGLSDKTVTHNIDSHLSQGTTTLLGVDGFASSTEVCRTNDSTPVRIMSGATRFASAYKAADIVDGSGFSSGKEGNSNYFMQEWDDTFILIGENGSGATLGGGVQDYYFIPKAVFKECGVELSEEQGKLLREACLGRFMHPLYDQERLTTLISYMGLEISPGRLYNLIVDTVLPPYEDAIAALYEGAAQSMAHRKKHLVHTATASMGTVLDLASLQGDLLIAGHANHTTFEREEMISLISELKSRGALIEACIFDLLTAEYDRHKLDDLLMLLSSGVIDILSTDYGGGNHSPLLKVLQIADSEGYLSFPESIALCTRNPASLIQGLAEERGFVREGSIADLCLVDKEDIANVRKVIINGIVVYAN
jgi:imidazolonepropionase-like amidohydrolase